jgi:hypothetical protein
MVKRAISVHQDLPAFTRYLFELRHKLMQIGGWQSE